MGVSKNRGTPKWMETPIKMDDLGIPLFLETPKYLPYQLVNAGFLLSVQQPATQVGRFLRFLLGCTAT